MTDHAHVGRVLLTITGIIIAFAGLNAAIEWVASHQTAVEFGAAVLCSTVVTALVWAVCNIKADR